MNKNSIIYQGKNGEIAFKGDLKKETIWATQAQIAEVFGINRTVVTKHIRNIFADKELDASVVSAKFAHTTPHGAIKEKTQTKEVLFYNLDIILAVGYRTSSSVAIKFRQWATKTLRTYITQGFLIHPKQIIKNHEAFLQAVESTRKLLPANDALKAEDALDLVKMFASTWVSLDAYDKSTLPKRGSSKKRVSLTAEELSDAITDLKRNLMKKKEATELFAQERSPKALAGIVGNVFQSVFGKDAYPTTEEKAAHLLYFIVKNHPFSDGNKRSGAFAFVWFLNKAGILAKNRMTPEALTALTLLVAESSSKEKERVIGLVLQLLKK